MERNFFDLNSSIGDSIGLGVGSNSGALNRSIGGIILADGSSIHVSTTFEDRTSICAFFSENHGGW